MCMSACGYIFLYVSVHTSTYLSQLGLSNPKIASHYKMICQLACRWLHELGRTGISCSWRENVSLQIRSLFTVYNMF